MFCFMKSRHALYCMRDKQIDNTHTHCHCYDVRELQMLSVILQRSTAVVNRWERSMYLRIAIEMKCFVFLFYDVRWSIVMTI